MPQGARRRLPHRATVQAADFKWTRGENHITWYCSSPGNYRGFCEACGAPLSRLDQTPEVMDCRWARLTMIPACGHRRTATWPTAPWFEITDDLPRHEGALEAAAESNP